MPMQTPLFADASPEPIMDINTTPLIDVMLVLLVMLIITIPIQLHAVKMELPTSQPPSSQAQQPPIRLDIDASNGVYWQGERMNPEQLEQHLIEAAAASPPPEIHLRADKHASYAQFASVLASTRRSGLNRVAVVGSEQFVQ